MSIFSKLFTCIALSFAVANISHANDKPKYYEPSDTIVILGAVPQEIPVLTEALENPEKKICGASLTGRVSYMANR